jgi:O-acetyl-ADP-ribose deacetylase (regulator of RNase III)
MIIKVGMFMIKIGDKNIIIKKGDITNEETDIIVNPANSALKHGGGAAAAIVKAGGMQIQKDSNNLIKKIGLLDVTSCVVTDGYKLPCKFIIHVVGPKMGEGNEEKKLKKAVENVLNMAETYGLKSISMPAISSGIFGFPKDKCAEILIKTTVEFLKNQPKNLETVVMCNYDIETYNIFLEKEKAYV